MSARPAEAIEPGGWAPYLDPGEHLLWEGAPAHGIRIRGSDIVQSVFGVFFLGFSIFWVAMAGSMGGGAGAMGMIFPLFGLSFVAVGAYLTIGHIFWKAHVRKHTAYALTTGRAIIAKSALGRSLRSFPISGGAELVYEPGEPATIWFARETRGTHKNRRTVRHGFEYIADGDRVYHLMRAIQQGRIGGPEDESKD